MNDLFVNGGIDFIGSFLHLGIILELSFVIAWRSCTLKANFFYYFVHFPCVHSFHVCLCFHTCIMFNFFCVSNVLCRNPSLGLVTKTRACKGAGQEGSLGVTSHAPGNVG
jgi:hypothetical protein